MIIQNRVIYLAIAILLLALGLAVARFRPTPAGQDGHALATTFTGLNAREPITLESYHGQVVVLDIWATWCPPCVHEIPEMIAFHNEMVSTQQPVQFIGISIDTDTNAVRQFVQKQKVTYPVGFGDANSMKPLGGIPRAVPTKLIIDKDGAIVDKIIGSTDAKTLKQKIAPYLP